MRILLLIFCGLLLFTFTSCNKDVEILQKSLPSETLSVKAGSGTGNGSKNGNLKDIDGNTYKTVLIGNQVWMAENLKVTRYKNGDTIPYITDGAAWGNRGSGAWCYYGNNSALNFDYGKLYNWQAAVDARGLAPRGWHIPTRQEVELLIIFLGGYDFAGAALKETGLIYWASPNLATNTSNFSARPAGFREQAGIFNYINTHSFFWTSTSYDNGSANFFGAQNIVANVLLGHGYMDQGFSIRCIKD